MVLARDMEGGGVRAEMALHGAHGLGPFLLVERGLVEQPDYLDQIFHGPACCADGPAE